MVSTEEERVRGAAMRWYVAYQETLRIRIETDPHIDESKAAWDLFVLLAEEITDLAIRRQFAWLFAHEGRED